MIVRIFLLFVALVLISTPGHAEYYKYKDANGVIRFTDNLLEVPKDQREKIEVYKEVVTPEPTSELSEDQEEGVSLKDQISQVEQMNRERENLEQIYNDLDAERKSLMENSPNPQDQEAYQTYRKRVEDFNVKIKSYENQRKAFQAKVDAYNAEIESQ